MYTVRMKLSLKSYCCGLAILFLGCDPEGKPGDDEGNSSEDEAAQCEPDASSTSETDTAVPADEAEEAVCNLDRLNAIGVSKCTIDCGFLTGEESDQAWRDAQTCVLEAIADQREFTLTMRIIGDDSNFYYKFVGTINGEYELHSYTYDDYFPEIDGQLCSSITETPDCVVESSDEEVDAGQLCLSCSEVGEPYEACSE